MISTCFCSRLFQNHCFFVLCPFLPRVKHNFFLGPPTPPFFSFSSRFQLPKQQQQQIIAKFVIFSCIIISLTHMGSDLSKLHHSAPYCPTQELPKKLHATSRHPKLIAHVHNFKIVLSKRNTHNKVHSLCFYDQIS